LCKTLSSMRMICDVPTDAPLADDQSGLHGRLVESLGLSICGGELAPATVLFIDDLMTTHSVSRSVVREALRVLSSMGLVASRRRVGTLVLERSAWNVYDPLVIRWRLATGGRLVQLRSITELRTAVEPQAARLAAERAKPLEASELVTLAGQLWAAGQDGRMDDFLRLDVQFHKRVLAASGNEMFEHLHKQVAEVLAGRHAYGLMPHHPHVDALQLHSDVAASIQRGDGDRAHAAMVAIMDRTMGETRQLWEQQGNEADDTVEAAAVES